MLSQRCAFADIPRQKFAGESVKGQGQSKPGQRLAASTLAQCTQVRRLICTCFYMTYKSQFGGLS